MADIGNIITLIRQELSLRSLKVIELWVEEEHFPISGQLEISCAADFDGETDWVRLVTILDPTSVNEECRRIAEELYNLLESQEDN